MWFTWIPGAYFYWIIPAMGWLQWNCGPQTSDSWFITGGWFQPSWKILVNGKDYPIYYGKLKTFQTTSQIIYGYKSMQHIWASPLVLCVMGYTTVQPPWLKEKTTCENGIHTSCWISKIHGSKAWLCTSSRGHWFTFATEHRITTRWLRPSCCSSTPHVIMWPNGWKHVGSGSTYVLTMGLYQTETSLNLHQNYLNPSVHPCGGHRAPGTTLLLAVRPRS